MTADRIKALFALAEDHERIAASARDAIRGPDSMSPKDHARAAKTIRAALAASQPTQPVTVKVKPLVWAQFGQECIRTETVLGRYEIM